MSCFYCLIGENKDERTFYLREGRKTWSKITYKLCEDCKKYLQGVYKVIK